MSRLKSLTVSTALSVSVAVMYTLCALVVALFPGLASTITIALFHGLNFSTGDINMGAFTFASFVTALLTLSVWGFIAGGVCCFFYNRMVARSSEEKSSYTASNISPRSV